MVLYFKLLQILNLQDKKVFWQINDSALNDKEKNKLNVI